MNVSRLGECFSKLGDTEKAKKCEQLAAELDSKAKKREIETSHPQIQPNKSKNVGSSWNKLWIPITILIIAVIGLGFWSYGNYSELQTTRQSLATTTTNLNTARNELASTTSLLQSTQNELNTTKTTLANTTSQLNSANSQLSSTKTQLQSVQTQLQSTQSQLQSTQTQLTQFMNTDTGQVLDAKKVVDQFFSNAVSGNYLQMWNVLHPDSQKEYLGELDFESNNAVAEKDGYYLLSSYFIGEGKMLSSWKSYSNVVDIQVVVISEKNGWANLILGLIPIISDLNSMAPSTEVATWDAHCVLVNGQWQIFCERNSPAPQTPPSSQVTIVPPDGNGVYKLTSSQLIQSYATNRTLTQNAYFNKTLQLTGTIVSFGSTDNVVYLSFTDPSSSQTVRCYFQVKPTQWSSLKVGQSVTLQGIWKYDKSQLDIDNCSLVG